MKFVRLMRCYVVLFEWWVTKRRQETREKIRAPNTICFWWNNQKSPLRLLTDIHEPIGNGAWFLLFFTFHGMFFENIHLEYSRNHSHPFYEFSKPFKRGDNFLVLGRLLSSSYLNHLLHFGIALGIN